MVTIVVLKEHRELLAGVSDVSSVVTSKGLLLATVQRSTRTVAELRRQNAGVVRLLDRFLLVSGGSPQELDRLYLEFFWAIADQYEELIHPRRNIANIRNLLRMARVAPGTDLVLDYGCGTGLALPAGTTLDIRPNQFVGVDVCPLMRRQARKRGMRVLSPGELRSGAQWSVDAIVASYVFHLPTAEKGLVHAWARLRQGGVLVGNCHKGMGVVEVSAAVTGLGGSRLRLPQPDERHGVYVGFRK